MWAFILKRCFTLFENCPYFTQLFFFTFPSGSFGSSSLENAHPAVSIWQLQTAPAGKQFCLHYNPASWSVCDQDTVSYTISLLFFCTVLSFQIVLVNDEILKKCSDNTSRLWSLTSMLTSSQCYKEDGTSKNPDCPVCSKSLNKLAQPLPMAHCANSRLVCKISGEVMNENNPPMMLPNGYVYGYNVSTVQLR